jgi:hypothetical protein
MRRPTSEGQGLKARQATELVQISRGRYLQEASARGGGAGVQAMNAGTA